MAEPKSPVIAIENAGAVTQNGDTWTEIHFTLLDYEGVVRYDSDDRPASLDVLFGRDDHDASLSLRKPAKNGQIEICGPCYTGGFLVSRTIRSHAIFSSSERSEVAYSVRFGGDWRIESKLKSYAKIDGLVANLSPRPKVVLRWRYGMRPTNRDPPFDYAGIFEELRRCRAVLDGLLARKGAVQAGETIEA